MASQHVSVKIKLIRFSFAILSVMAQPLAVAWAYRIWFRSPRYNIARREFAWREQARRVVISSRYGRIMTWHWGDADRPRIFFVHGWSGRGTQLGAFIEPLLAAGYSVTGFDAPGHGDSEGDSSSLFMIAEVLRQIVLEARHPFALIAHSFGCVVSAYALRNYQLPIQKLVAISSSTSTRYPLERFMRYLHFSPALTDAFLKRYKQDFGDDVFERTAADNNLRGWHGKLLVIHDKDDDIVHWQHGEQLAASMPDSQVLYTQSLGHRRILYDNSVIEHTVSFLQHNTPD